MSRGLINLLNRIESGFEEVMSRNKLK